MHSRRVPQATVDHSHLPDSRRSSGRHQCELESWRVGINGHFSFGKLLPLLHACSYPSPFSLHWFLSPLVTPHLFDLLASWLPSFVMRFLFHNTNANPSSLDFGDHTAFPSYYDLHNLATCSPLCTSSWRRYYQYEARGFSIISLPAAQANLLHAAIVWSVVPCFVVVRLFSSTEAQSCSITFSVLGNGSSSAKTGIWSEPCFSLWQLLETASTWLTISSDVPRTHYPTTQSLCIVKPIIISCLHWHWTQCMHCVDSPL